MALGGQAGGRNHVADRIGARGAVVAGDFIGQRAEPGPAAIVRERGPNGATRPRLQSRRQLPLAPSFSYRALPRMRSASPALKQPPLLLPPSSLFF